MIKLEFVEPATEQWRAWIAECQAKTESLIACVARGGAAHISDLYKDRRMKQVYMADAAPFFGKCAYCESRIGGDQPGDIEHFRPKSKVTDEDGHPVMIVKEDGTETPHPGYYWLAYECSNLLYACADCNRPSSMKTGGVVVGKWNKFPVRGQHAVRPEGEADEEPLLLNPLFTDPKDHLSIDDTGVVCGKTDEGNACIRILGLNSREALIKDRMEALTDTQNAVLALVTACAQEHAAQQKTQLEKLERVQSGGAPFAMARRFALDRAKADFASFFNLMGVDATADGGPET